ncbi:MAG: ATP-binding protein [Spirochaetales bacterium]|nr:ATP-binding protein [Spirochaetales bacterium]
MHILDIVENSINANATQIGIALVKDSSRKTLTIVITDNGNGMVHDEVNRTLDPFYTTKEGKRIGLGLPLYAQSVRECGGTFSIESGTGSGTKITAVFMLDHPDCKKIGDMDETIYVLKASHPEIEFNYTYEEVW